MTEGHSSGHAREQQRPTGRAVLADMLLSLRSVGDDLSAAQLVTILFLSSEGSQSVKALAESLRLSESTIAALYPRLVARGLVIGIPSRSNPHEVAIILSTAGHRFVDNLIYQQGRRSGAFPQVPVTDSDLHRRSHQALRLT